MTDLAQPAASAELGVLVSRSPSSGAERRWSIRGSDALWLARMLVAEDGTYRDANEGYHVGRVMVSMIVRRLAVTFHAGPYQSVEHLLRGDESGGNPKGWSQPLRWYGIRRETDARLLALYRRSQSRTWDEIPDYYKRAVLDTVTGRVPLVAPHVVDAAAPAFTAARLADPAVGGAGGWRREMHGTRSWLISTTVSRGWPESDVKIVSRGAGIGGAGASALLVLLAAGAAWLGYRGA